MARPSNETKQALDDGLKWFDIQNYIDAYQTSLHDETKIIRQIWTRIYLQDEIDRRRLTPNTSSWQTWALEETEFSEIMVGKVVMSAHLDRFIYHYYSRISGENLPANYFVAQRRTRLEVAQEFADHYDRPTNPRSHLKGLIDFMKGQWERQAESRYPLIEVDLNAPNSVILAEVENVINKLRADDQRDKPLSHAKHDANSFKADHTLAIIDLLIWQSILELPIPASKYSELLSTGARKISETQVKEKLLPRAYRAFDATQLGIIETALSHKSKN